MLFLSVNLASISFESRFYDYIRSTCLVTISTGNGEMLSLYGIANYNITRVIQTSTGRAFASLYSNEYVYVGLMKVL